MKKQREVVLFLVKFFASYFILFVIYSVYLQQRQSKGDVFQCDDITVLVSKQTKSLMESFGFDIKVEQHSEELSVKLILNDIYTARVIEGCNSVSIIILFLAFIIAFKGSLVNTVCFGLLGGIVIYLVNIARIALLTVLLQKFPDGQVILHNLIFPAIIYGTTFLLWVIWIQKLSFYKR